VCTLSRGLPLPNIGPEKLLTTSVDNFVHRLSGTAASTHVACPSPRMMKKWPFY